MRSNDPVAKMPEEGQHVTRFSTENGDTPGLGLVWGPDQMQLPMQF